MWCSEMCRVGKEKGGGVGGVQCWVWFEVHCVVRVGVSFLN